MIKIVFQLVVYLAGGIKVKCRILFVLIPFMLVLSSCDDDESKGDGLSYAGYIPNFSVNTPDNSVGGSRSMLKSAGEALEPLEDEETSGDRIDCSSELRNWNTVTLNSAYSLPLSADADSELNCTASPTIFCSEKRIGMVLNLYAQSLFYDCNARQQLQEDGLTKKCVLRAGASGTHTVGGDDLCAEGDELVDVNSFTLIKKMHRFLQKIIRVLFLGPWTLRPRQKKTWKGL